MRLLDMPRRSFLGATAGLFTLRAQLGSKASAQEAAGGGRLTLHAIDTYFGQTRPGLRIDLSMLESGAWQQIKSVETVQGGRTETPVLEPGKLQIGRYELLLHLADYFEQNEANLPEPPFLDAVPIRFGVFDAGQNFHVPILFSPWNYSYYRGS